MRGFLLLLLGLLHTVAASAADNDALALGDKAYAQKAWDSAAAYYSRAASNGDAIALYKLGNAEYRRRHTGDAVVAWCRALKARPGFAPAKQNIQAVQEGLRFGQKSGSDAALVEGWRALTKPEASNQWALMSLLIFFLMAGALAWRRLRHIPPPRRSFLAGSVISGVLFAALAVYAAYAAIPRNAAVVMRADAPMQSDAGGNSVLSLPEGLLVEVRRTEKNTVHILLRDGRSGIVQAIDIAIVR